MTAEVPSRRCLLTASCVILLGSLLATGQVLAGAASEQSVTPSQIDSLRSEGQRQGWTFTVRKNAATERPLNALTGLKLSDTVITTAPAPLGSAVTLPERYVSLMPPVRNQGFCGSCWAFGANGAVEAAIIKAFPELQNTIDLSEQHLLDCTPDNCDGGSEDFAYYANTRDACGRIGAITEALYPFTGIENSCKCTVQRQFWLDSWGYVSGSSGQEATVEQVKAAILQYGAVTCLVYTNSSFISYDSGVYNWCPSEWQFPNHMVVLYGWDDAYETVQTNSGTMRARGNPMPVWFLRNSWGPSWGINGNMLIDQRCANVLDYRCAYAVYSGNRDLDSDGVANDSDNCPLITNGDQSDSDSDGMGNACDPCPTLPDTLPGDADLDGIPDQCDNCWRLFNTDQADTDLDGIGDVCDNCPSVYNPDQANADRDGKGDLCDPCPLDFYNDRDRDGLCGNVDNCPKAANADQADTDGDGVGDVCDNCHLLPNSDQADADRDLIGDPCDGCPLDSANDVDGDGVCGNIDNCPNVYNPSQRDYNGNGTGDDCEFDVPLYDTVATSLIRLIVSNTTNFGRAGNFPYLGTNLDYNATGDCSSESIYKIYLVNGSPIVTYVSGSDTVLATAYGSLSMSCLVNVSAGNPTVSTMSTPSFDVFRSGTVVTPDSSIGWESTWWAPKAADSSTFVILAQKFYSFDGEYHEGISLGLLYRWQIPNHWWEFTVGTDTSLSLTWQRGKEDMDHPPCWNADRRFGGLALLGKASSASSSIQMPVAPSNAFCTPDDGSSILSIYPMFRSSGYHYVLPLYNGVIWGMTFATDASLGPGDTVIYYTAFSTVRNGTLDSLRQNVMKARQWLLDHFNMLDVLTCCESTTGNVNNAGLIDLSDLSMLIAYLTTPVKPTLPCLEAANVNGIGIIDLSDLSVLIAYLTAPQKPTLPWCP